MPEVPMNDAELRRVVEAAVPPKQLGSFSDATDLTLLFGPVITPHSRCAHPNEDIMAGLGIPVGPGDDILPEGYEVGRLAEASAAALTKLPASLFKPESDLTRRASLATAHVLCREHERATLLVTYAAVALATFGNAIGHLQPAMTGGSIPQTLYAG
jgi:hypothetical protein